MNEIEIVKIFNHPNVVKLIDIFENHNNNFIVLEYLEGCDHFEYFKKNTFNENLTRNMMKQLI